MTTAAAATIDDGDFANLPTFASRYGDVSFTVVLPFVVCYVRFGLVVSLLMWQSCADRRLSFIRVDRYGRLNE